VRIFLFVVAVTLAGFGSAESAETPKQKPAVKKNGAKAASTSKRVSVSYAKDGSKVAPAAVAGVAAAKASASTNGSGNELDIKSTAALVYDVIDGRTLYAKNTEQVSPIASITKLMTAMVILDRGLDLQTKIVLSRDDTRAIRGSRTRLRSGASLTRDELLMLSLMASENLAAAALGRTYPGGMDAFVEAMLRIDEEARKDPELVRTAPHTTPVRRLDEVGAARSPVLRWRAAAWRVRPGRVPCCRRRAACRAWRRRPGSPGTCESC